MRRSARFAYSVMLLAVTATALVIALRTSRADASQVPAATATRQERLKERDKFEKQAKDLHKGSAEAIQAALAVLAIEREVLGETSDDAISTINWIADLHQEASEWADALKALSEVEAILSRKLGKDHWRELTHTGRSTRFRLWLGSMTEGAANTLQADRLYTQGGRLMSQGSPRAHQSPATRDGDSQGVAGRGTPGLRDVSEQPGIRVTSTRSGGRGAREFQARAGEAKGAVFPVASRPGDDPDRPGDMVYTSRRLRAGDTLFRAGLATNESLYPREKFPQGHFRVAQSLTNLAYALRRQGPTEVVRRYLERATAMNEALYPEARFPKGHPDLATSLNDLGNLLGDQGDFVGAGGRISSGRWRCGECSIPGRRSPRRPSRTGDCPG